MPQIDMAMLASRTQPLFSRASSISSEVSSVKNTFSSWDNCMAESYCKWPVIAAIIIVGLIIFSVVWCIVRCACCGLSCCCGCFSCLKCCGECCGMCSGGRKNRDHKNIDDQFRSPAQPPFQPTPYTGYQPSPAMGYEAPKYAQFETGKNGLAVDPPKPVNADALPPMPSWDGAQSRRVMAEEQKEDGMEMGNLTPDGQNMPLMSGAVGGTRTPGATSPMNETGGFFGGRGAPGQYMPGQPNGNMPSGPGGISRTGSPAMMNGRGAGPGMNGQGMGYGGPNRGDAAMGGPPRGQFNQSPGPQGFNNQAPGSQGYNPQRPGFPPTAGYRGPPQRQYSNNSASSPYERNPPPQRQFSNGAGAPYPSNGPQRQFSNGAAGAPYSPNGPQRQFSGNGGFSQPGPQRQYSNDTYRPSQDMYRPPASPSSPLNNSGGFDFGLDATTSPVRYEPPQNRFGQDAAESNFAPSTTAAPSYHTRALSPLQEQQRNFAPHSNQYQYDDHDHERSYSPVQEDVHEMSTAESAPSRPDGGPAYPGYKPYSPAPMEGARSTPPPPPASLMPGRPAY